MTQYMISVSHDTAEAPTMQTMDPSVIQPIIDAVDAFNDRLRAEGACVFAGGLHPIQTATTVDNTGDAPVVTDGAMPSSRNTSAAFGSSRPTTSMLRWNGPKTPPRRARAGSRFAHSRRHPPEQ